MTAIQLIGHVFLILFVSENFLALENHRAHFIRRISGVKEGVDEILRYMRHIGRTKHHIEIMGRCPFHRIFKDAQRRGHHFVIDAADFQSLLISHRKNFHVLAVENLHVILQLIEISFPISGSDRLDIDFIRFCFRVRVSSQEIFAPIDQDIAVVHQVLQSLIVDRQGRDAALLIQIKKLVRRHALCRRTFQDIAVVVDHFHLGSGAFYLMALPGNPSARRGTDQNQNSQQFESCFL